MIKMEEKEMKKKNNKRETCKGWTGSQDEALYREKDVLWRSKEKLAGAKRDRKSRLWISKSSTLKALGDGTTME